MTTVVRLKRKGGIVVQNCDVYIGRECTLGGWNLPRSKWANPFRISPGKSIDTVLALYETHVRSNKELIDSLDELRGKRLGCWCKPNKCHGDILVKILNETSSQSTDSLSNEAVSK